MKIKLSFIYITFSVFFLVYLGAPIHDFPDPPTGSLQSFEPADVETPSRRGYFTDLKREEVILHYKKQLLNGYFSLFPVLRLNYPPEEAQVIIRDQTQSSYLEELTVPFRESIFINGFEPKEPKDVLIRQDKVWQQKVIVRQISSSFFPRIFIGILLVIFIPLLYNALSITLHDYLKRIKSI